MKKIIFSVALAGLFLAAAACGKKGGILPPFVYAPQKPENLKAVQRGQHIVLDWMNPASYVDGRPLADLAGIEIWMCETAGSLQAGVPELAVEEFEAKARKLTVIGSAEMSPPSSIKEFPKKEGPAATITKAPPAKEQVFEYLLAEYDLKAARLIFAVRVKEARKGRLSEFSDFASVSPQPLPMPPGNVQARVFEDRIEVSWEAPPENFDHSRPARLKGYNVYRIDSSDMLQRLNPGLVQEEKFADANFLFGQTVRYFIRAAAAEVGPILESDDSATVEVTPLDIFPPAAPLGLTAVRGADFITLIWDPGPEKDLAGYKVWRREAGQSPFAPLTAETILENTYTDSAVEKDKRYEYAITALDRNGNESPKSGIASEMIRAERS